ncbi:MAG: hypothetical protein QW165_01825 [Candidatus Woesearchaeota archaeon]
MLKEVIIFVIGCLVLVKSAEYTVRSIVHLARAIRLTEFVTSFILVAVVAALPDAFISITSAISGNAPLGVGTLLGGNIADLTLILGLVALAGNPIRIHSSIVKKDLYFAALAILPIMLGVDGQISRLDGIILLSAGIIFLLVLLKERQYFTKPYKNGNFVVKNTFIFFASIAVMLVSAHFIVESGTSLAVMLNVPSILLGAVLLGLGTTLPEFMFSLQSIRKGHADLAIGDLLGNVVIDSCILMGIVALIAPISIELVTWGALGIFTAFSMAFALIFMRSDGILSKNEAMALILFYVAFVVTQIFLR